MKRFNGKTTAVLIAMLVLIVIFAGISVSKYVIGDKKEIEGRYTDFVISYEGDNQAAVLNGNVAYVGIKVRNFTESKLSKRDVTFRMRAPTGTESDAGKVSDAFGNELTIHSESKNYQVSIETSGSDESGFFRLEKDNRNEFTLIVKITRTSGGALDLGSTEKLSLILETDKPYKDMKVLTIHVSNARISVGVDGGGTYQGFDEIKVNLKSSVNFVYENETVNPQASYKAKIVLRITGNAIFDSGRFEEQYTSVTERSGEWAYFFENGTLTFTIESGADMYLYFYAAGDCSITAEAYVYDKDSPEKEQISGLGTSENGVYTVYRQQ